MGYRGSLRRGSRGSYWLDGRDETELRFSDGLIALFCLLSFLLLLGAEGVFIWLLVRSKNAARDALKLTQLRELATKELGVAHGRTLSEPELSVTEHTTRTLEPVYRERKTEEQVRFYH